MKNTNLSASLYDDTFVSTILRVGGGCEGEYHEKITSHG